MSSPTTFTSQHLGYLAIILLFLCCSPALAQDANTLLWRIEGKGLETPSYLYGTMHARDQRVYDFADSVDITFRRCQGFAMEMTLDSMVAFLLGTHGLISQYQGSNNNAYAVLAPLLEHRTTDTIPLLIPTTDNTALFPYLQSITRENLLLSNDNPTIVDAYFYRLARQQHKVIASLESTDDMQKLVLSIVNKTIEEQYKTYYRYHEEENTETLSQDEEETEEEGDLKKKESSLFSLRRGDADSLALDSMATLYRDGNLQQMEYIMEQGLAPSGIYEALITKRNYNMKAALLPMIHQRSTFIAVGAGHLPGKEGLIELLRNEGYTVSPVPITRVQEKKAALANSTMVQWHTHFSPQGGYSIDFPAQPLPSPLGMFRNIAAECNTVVYPDISSGITYIATYTDMLHQASEQKTTEFIAKHMQHWLHLPDAILLCTEQIRGEAISGQKICMRLPDNNYYAMQMVSAHKRLYIQLAIAPSDTLYPEEVHRFFSSFRSQPLPTERPSLYTSVHGAFSVRFPAQWHEQPNGQTHGSPQYAFDAHCSDAATGIHYRTGYRQEERGLFPYEQYSPVQAFYSYSLRSHSTTIDTTFATYPASIFVLQDSTHTVKLHVVARGSRLYYLLADIPHGTAITKSDKVFASFRFLDYAPTSFSTLTVDSLSYSVDIPQHAPDNTLARMDTHIEALRRITDRPEKDGLTSSLHFQQYLDEHTGLYYTVQIHNFGLYYYTQNTDTLFLQWIDNNSGYAYGYNSDTLRVFTPLSINGFPACSYSRHSTTGYTVKKGVLALRGDTLYHLSVVVPTADTSMPDIQRFLSSLHLHQGEIHSAIFTPKSASLLQDIASGVLSVQKKAYGSLSAYAFTHSDIPLLYEALQRSYANDTLSYRSTRGILLEKLQDFHDSTTVPFLSALYAATNDAPIVQTAIVQTLASLNTHESISTLSALLQAYTPTTQTTPYTMFMAMKEQPQYIPILLPALRTLFEKDQWLDDVYPLIITALDSAVITRSTISAWHLNLVQNFRDHYTEFSRQSEDDLENEEYKNYYNLQRNILHEARLLGEFNNPDTVVSLLQALTYNDDKYIAIEACTALLRGKKQPANNALDSLAHDAYTRIQLYRRMQNTGTLAHFPPLYNTQEALAEAVVTEYLTDYEELYLPHCTLVATRDISDGPQAGRYFLFTFSYDSEEESEPELYGILCGPQPLDSTQFSLKEEQLQLGKTQWKEDKSAEYFDTLLSEAAKKK